MKRIKKEYSVVSFENQTFYIGIDVHKKSWSVNIRMGGLNVKNFVLSPGGPKELKDYLEKHYKGGKYIAVYEAGYCGFWIQRELCKLGIECMVVNPADIPSTHKDKLSKTDMHDSRKLSERLEKNDIKGIYIPVIEDQSLRSLCRLRSSIVKDMTRVKNRIKGFLYLYGYKVDYEGNSWTKKYMKELEKLSKECECGITLELLTNELKIINRHLDICEKKIRREFKKNKEKQKMVDLLTSVPGISFVSAVTLASEIIDINRFKNFDHFASFAGIIPSTYNSGEKERSGGKTPRGNKWINRILIESSWIAIRHDPALLKRYGDLCKHKKSKDAIIRIAKKLLNRIYHILKTETPYKKGIM